MYELEKNREEKEDYTYFKESFIHFFWCYSI